METCMLVYVTTPSKEEAMNIGRTVVEEKLAACANIVPGAHSFYRWEDEVQEAEEAILLLKTKETALEKLIVRIRQLHASTCPCIACVPISEGNPDFLAWIVASTEA